MLYFHRSVVGRYQTYGRQSALRGRGERSDGPDDYVWCAL